MSMRERESVRIRVLFVDRESERERERVALFTSLVYDLFMSDAAMLIFTSVEKEAKNQ